MTLYVNWALTLPKFEGNVKACPQYIYFLMSERARGFLHVHYFLRLDVQSAFCTSVGGHFQPPGQVAQNHPRTPPEWPCRWDFGPVWAICCRFGPCGNFQPPGQVPLSPPELPFQRDFGPVWAICCRFGPGGHFQHPGKLPYNPFSMAFSTRFQPVRQTVNMVHCDDPKRTQIMQNIIFRHKFRGQHLIPLPPLKNP